jgi:SAM-dependent methyltransferase/uncharacterized protein YbaR (Trm112 family)
MNILPGILEHLMCLYCHKGKFDLCVARSSLVCAHCGREYPVVNNIPVLIKDEDSLFSRADFIAQRNTFFDLTDRGRSISRISQLLPSMESHMLSRRNYERLSNLLNEEEVPRILFIGASIEGNHSDILLNHPKFSIVESDVSLGPRTQIILDAHNIPYQDESFDCVVVQAVLEHIIDPHRCVSEIARILRMGGIVYAETPFMQQVHGGPYDFTRFTRSGHRWLFRQFAEVDSGATSGPGSAMAWCYQYLLLSLLGYTHSVRLFIKGFARITGFWLKYLDLLMLNNPYMSDAACGLYFLGTKADRALGAKDIIRYYNS